MRKKKNPSKIILSKTKLRYGCNYLPGENEIGEKCADIQEIYPVVPKEIDDILFDVSQDPVVRRS